MSRGTNAFYWVCHDTNASCKGVMMQMSFGACYDANVRLGVCYDANAPLQVCHDENVRLGVCL